MNRLRESLIVASIVLQGVFGSRAAGAQEPDTLATGAAASASVAATGTITLDSTESRESNARTSSVVFALGTPAGVTGAGALRLPTLLQEQDTIPRRRAVAYSDWYSRRLTIHRYGSYAMLPLFVTQFVLGTKLLNQKEDLYEGKRAIPVDKGLRSTHAAVAGAVGTLFIVNTTTGVWNLIESRKTEEGRMRRTIHALTMLTADAGFAYVGYLGSKATDRGPPQARKHRNTALGSMIVSTAGASIMWFGQR